MLERSALRADSPVVLGLVARRKLAPFAALTTLRQTRRSQTTKRAARAATSPVLLSASQAHPNTSPRNRAAGAAACRGLTQGNPNGVQYRKAVGGPVGARL